MGQTAGFAAGSWIVRQTPCDKPSLPPGKNYSPPAVAGGLFDACAEGLPPKTLIAGYR
jgi:hypothetical protein